MHKLMIKIHNVTGLKYLCYTKKSGSSYDEYLGSGKLWKEHLKQYGKDIKTELIYETDDYENFVNYSLNYSIENDIVNSKDWANLKFETGDGGNTVSNKRWITNGKIDIYINENVNVPDGWKYGRSNCVFKDSRKQKEFNKLADPNKKRISMQNAWKNGKFKDRISRDISGDKNPTKNEEVRKKLSNSRKKPVEVYGIKYDSFNSACRKLNVCYKTIHKLIKNGKANYI